MKKCIILSKKQNKIPSSAGYHDLYNTKGENPWNSKSQLLNKSKMSTLTLSKIESAHKLRQHSKLASRSTNKSANHIIHKSTGKMTTQDGGDNSEEGSIKDELKITAKK